MASNLHDGACEITEGLDATCYCGCRYDRRQLEATLDRVRAELAQAKNRARRSPVPWTRHECDLCDEPLEGKSWRWVEEGWSLICADCETRVTAQVTAERDALRARCGLYSEAVTILMERAHSETCGCRDGAMARLVNICAARRRPRI